MHVTNYRVLSILLALCIGLIGSLVARDIEVCTNPVDIFFLIDGSGSLGEEEFIRSKQLVSEILTLYDHSAQNKAGYAVFTSTINNVRYLTPEINLLLVHLEFEQYPGTSTDLYNALQFVHQNVFTHAKRQENTQRVLVVFTDGKDDRNVAELSRKLELERRVKIFVFAFGNNLDQAQLEDIATDPDNKTLFTFPTVSGGIDSIQMLSEAICPDIECCTRGKEGKRGQRGLEGVTGDKGEMGGSGICKMRDPACTKRLRKGEKGYKGQRGPQGTTGIRGEMGVTGVGGLQGEQGEIGQQGLKGIKGEVGEKGQMGIQGKRGPNGETGQIGDQGIKGDVGQQGPKGIKGEVGPIGVCRNSTFNTEFSCKGQKVSDCTEFNSFLIILINNTYVYT
ncbi:Collagen alpha-2(VI) chain isoform X2 [Oopsacas minuta]|uniref:Collagen alpha-2(VI) chain isoform X2 n=1 Tax=Oopsacas minuta TaxID=111878 RepID=A0AAV7JB30_9METZ|nr:Collagen alpha-2(VI) chain isoform X2 [Oopsacas minuta]